MHEVPAAGNGDFRQEFQTASDSATTRYNLPVALTLALSHNSNPKMLREVVQLPWQDKAAALKKGLGKVKAGTQCSQV